MVSRPIGASKEFREVELGTTIGSMYLSSAHSNSLRTFLSHFALCLINFCIC